MAPELDRVVLGGWSKDGSIGIVAWGENWGRLIQVVVFAVFRNSQVLFYTPIVALPLTPTSILLIGGLIYCWSLATMV